MSIARPIPKDGKSYKVKVFDPRHIADGILGTIHWQNEVSGFCRCPGEGLHTSPTGRKDCRMNLDGVPTIYCFHSSCIGAVSEANRRWRRALGGSPWEIALPGGRVLPGSCRRSNENCNGTRFMME